MTHHFKATVIALTALATFLGTESVNAESYNHPSSSGFAGSTAAMIDPHDPVPQIGFGQKKYRKYHGQDHGDKRRHYPTHVNYDGARYYGAGHSYGDGPYGASPYGAPYNAPYESRLRYGGQNRYDHPYYGGNAYEHRSSGALPYSYSEPRTDPTAADRAAYGTSSYHFESRYNRFDGYVHESGTYSITDRNNEDGTFDSRETHESLRCYAPYPEHCR
jgi:hypothetical protein